MKFHSFWYYMSEKAKINSKKLIILISTIFLIMVAVAGLAIVFFINYNAFTPSVPKVIDDGKSIYISAELNDNYCGYRFKFTNQAQDIIIDSDKNVLSTQNLIENGLELGNTYNISMCYLSKKSGNNSEFSKETNWTFYDYLSSPELSYNSEEKILEWNEIENADYYRVYFNGGSNDYVETEEKFLNLETFDCGKRIFTVLAYSNIDYYKQSAASNEVEVSIVKYLKNFSDISFDYDTKTITAESEEIYDKVIVIIGSKPYEIQLQTPPQKVGEIYVYTINVEIIYNNETLIGIYPQDKDEFNIYDGTSVRYCEVEIPDSEGEL